MYIYEMINDTNQLYNNIVVNILRNNCYRVNRSYVQY